ncbi:MAG: ABC transporter ATP-binding protein [Planctomycetota bacterium]
MSETVGTALPSIVLEHATRWYGPVIALNDVSVCVRPGATGLVGPNGAGKTTLLRLITGQIRPSQGKVLVLGAPPFANPRVAVRLGYAPEHDDLWEALTGEELLTSLLLLSGFSRATARLRAGEALATTGLTDVALRKVGGYSKGMRQRLRIAQAIAHDPEVLVLDEPLTGLDPLGRRQISELLRHLGREGRTILLSSHVLHEVEAITRTIVLLHRGRIVAEGDVRVIRDLIDEHPHHVTLETGRPREVAPALLDLPGVIGLRFEGPTRLTIETREPDRFYAALAELIVDGSLEIRRLESPDDNLQAVFEYLVP